MHRLSISAAVVTAAILSAAAGGCGSSEARKEVVKVQGSVSYKGKPVPKGTITFQPEGDGLPAHGMIQPDGTYQMSTYGEGDGAAVGRYQVTIVAKEGSENLMPSSPGYVPPKEIVPKKYSDPKVSGLSANVTKDGPAIDFNLQ